MEKFYRGICQLLILTFLTQPLSAQTLSSSQVNQLQSLSSQQRQNLINEYKHLIPELNQRQSRKSSSKTTESTQNQNDPTQVANENIRQESIDETELVKDKKLSTIEQLFFELELEYSKNDSPEVEVSQVDTENNSTNQLPGNILQEIENQKPEEHSSLIIPPKTTFQYGYDIFNKNINSNLDDSVMVNDDYKIGPGDQFTLYIWGSIEQKLPLTVTNKGEIFLPKVGIINVSGASFHSLSKIIKSNLSKHYVNFDVSIVMDNIRMLDIFILGEISQPGVYRVSSLSTAFLALLNAGGPTKMGSLRNIQLKRNGRTVKVIDLYDYLLTGNNSQDAKLQNFDTIFIPPIETAVKITGEVKRPAIFEVTKSTSIYDVIFSLSGGLLPSSDDKQIQILRLNDNESRLKLQKVADFPIIDTERLKTETVKNGDILIIHKSQPIKLNDVYIKGDVFKSGRYEYKEGMTIADLIDNAEGLTPDAYTDYLVIYRLTPEGKKHILSTSIDQASEITLLEKDVVEIFPKSRFRQAENVAIFGRVENPGKYQLLEGMKLKDILLLASLEEDANKNTAELIRNFNTKDQFMIKINPEDVLSSPLDSSANISLKDNDYIFIREEKQYYNAITITGEVNFPGVYLMKPNEKISDIIKRAGGYTNNAFLRGVQLIRESTKLQRKKGQEIFLENEEKRLVFDKTRFEGKNQVSSDNNPYESALNLISKELNEQDGRLVIDFEDIANNTKSKNNIALENNDQITVPSIPTSVTVIGGVMNNKTVLHIENKNLDYYISKAGGYSDFAERNQILIVNADGSVTKNKQSPEAGDIIYIPEKINYPVDWLDILSKTAQIIFNVAVTFSVVKDL